MANASQATVAGKIENILLAEIDFDPKWNARLSVKGSEGLPEEEDNGDTSYEYTKASIKAKGQDEAIIVRPHPVKGSKKPYACVAGFRRGSIIAELAEERKEKAPTIKAEVRNLSEREARSLNLRENTSRDALSPPDLAVGIKDLTKAAKANGETLTQEQTAAELGLSQSYVAKLISIMGGCTEKVVQAWRESASAVSVAKMVSISKLDAADQEKAFRNALGAKKGTGGKNAWKKNMVTAAENIGKDFGILVRRGLIKLTDEKSFFDCDGGLGVLMSVNAKATDADKSKAEKHAHEAYKLARDTEEEEEEEETDEEEVSTKGKGKGKRGNGAAASAN